MAVAPDLFISNLSKGNIPMAQTQHRKIFVAVLLLLAFRSSFAQTPDPIRPKITGISHVGYFVSDLPKALAFWHDLLGFDESYSLPKKDSQDIRIAFIKVND